MLIRVPSFDGYPTCSTSREAGSNGTLARHQTRRAPVATST